MRVIGTFEFAQLREHLPVKNVDVTGGRDPRRCLLVRLGGQFLRQPAIKLRSQLHAAEWLGQVVVHADVQTIFLILFHSVGGQRDNRCALPAPGFFTSTDLNGRFKSIQLRHVAIHQDNVERATREGFQRFVAVIGDHDFEAL